MQGCENVPSYLGDSSGCTIVASLTIFSRSFFSLNARLFGHRGLSCDFACSSGDLNFINISAGKGQCSSGVTLKANSAR